MDRLLFSCLRYASVWLLLSSALCAQAVRFEVKVAGDAAVASRIPQNVRNATKTDAAAPKLKLEASVSAAGARTPIPAVVEWYVFGRTSEQGKQAGRAVTELAVMQASKETLSVGSAGARTAFFAYAPGQERNGLKSEGWLARLVSADGRLLDVRGSAPGFLALAKDEARLNALAVAKPDAEVPLEVVAKIKAEAEKNWPNNPEMQATEIKLKLEAHKAAYRK